MIALFVDMFCACIQIINANIIPPKMYSKTVFLPEKDISNVVVQFR
jgi:hypothetical protein